MRAHSTGQRGEAHYEKDQSEGSIWVEGGSKDGMDQSECSIWQGGGANNRTHQSECRTTLKRAY